MTKLCAHCQRPVTGEWVTPVGQGNYIPPTADRPALCYDCWAKEYEKAYGIPAQIIR